MAKYICEECECQCVIEMCRDYPVFCVSDGFDDAVWVKGGRKNRYREGRIVCLGLGLLQMKSVQGVWVNENYSKSIFC